MQSPQQREQNIQEHALPNPSSAPLTRALVPPVEQFFDAMPVWLYSALLGNGRLLVCLDEAGSLAQLFYPHIDAGPHVRSFLTGIQVSEVVQADDSPMNAPPVMQQAVRNGTVIDDTASGNAISWLNDSGWMHELRYAERTAVIQDTASNATAGVQIERTMAVHPDVDVLTIEIKVNNHRTRPLHCKLVTYADFDIDQRRSGNCCFFDIERSVLTFFSSDRYITIACDAPVHGFASERSSTGKVDRVFQDASAGTFSGREYAVGQVSGAICHDFGLIEAGGTTLQRIHLCFGRSLHEVMAVSSSVAAKKQSIEETITWWRAHYADSQLEVGSKIARSIYSRSLIVLRLLTDRRTGGIVAAPECDPDFVSSGGYGMCWPRDCAYNAHALDSVGQHDHARACYEWALHVQSFEGVWYQRYFTDGKLASIWGLVQFDETGAVVWAICRHIKLTGDNSYGQKVFSQLVRACEYMHAALDSATGLAPLTKDLWEERDGISTYACACTWGAFHELSELAVRLGKATEAEHWSSAAANLKRAIETHLWDATQERFLRGIRMKMYSDDIERLRREPGFSASDILETESVGKIYYSQRHDATIDTSILALSVPFGVFAPSDPRILATAEAVAKYLTSPVGGILRYPNDAYRGGNPWVICTLWLAWQDLLAGKKERALDLYTWVLEHRTVLDLLPEQIDRATGKPCWIIPLAWSHAMFLLVTRALVEHGLLL